MELFDVLHIFVPKIEKSLTAESGPKGKRKSACISKL